MKNGYSMVQPFVLTALWLLASLCLIRTASAQSEVKLTAGDAAAGDRFGIGVSISGDLAIVGAWGDDNWGGAASIFHFDETGWSEEAKLTPSDAAASDIHPFGGRWTGSVSISGDLAIVGAPHDPAGSERPQYPSGSAYIFRRNGGSWSEEAKLTASDAAAGDLFGVAVSISGDVAIVGAWRDNNWRGSAYVFRRNGTGWSEEAKLTASDAAAGRLFGYGVSISGDVAIVGAARNSDSGSFSGAAYVFRRNGAGWSEEAKLTASDASSWAFFGQSVSISGDVAIVGAAGDASGSAYVFRHNGAGWIEEAKLTAGDAAAGDQFGGSGVVNLSSNHHAGGVSISGDLAIVGAARNDDAGSSSGSAYVFRRNETGWSEETKLTASDAAAGDLFGVAVSISGDLAIVGAAWDDDGGFQSGSAYVYDPTVPVADAGPDFTILISQSVTFDGSGSFDIDGQIREFEWDFGDGFSGAESPVTHTYTTAGTFTVTLTVTDDDGKQATDEATVTVQTPAEATQDLVDEVGDLVTVGTLNNGQGNALQAKLQAAIQQLDNGNEGAAINQLGAFINQVNAFINNGTLTPEEGQALLDAAQAIIEVLGGGPSARVGAAGVGVSEALGVTLPERYALLPNYPNPFNPSTEIRFDLPESVHVRLVVYDVMGREVARLVDQPLSAGTHRVRWDASGLPSGTYLYRLTAGSFTETRQMVLLK